MPAEIKTSSATTGRPSMKELFLTHKGEDVTAMVPTTEKVLFLTATLLITATSTTVGIQSTKPTNDLRNQLKFMEADRTSGMRSGFRG